jgi:hypothetical protein
MTAPSRTVLAANIHRSSGVIWGIPDKIALGTVRKFPFSLPLGDIVECSKFVDSRHAFIAREILVDSSRIAVPIRVTVCYENAVLSQVRKKATQTSHSWRIPIAMNAQYRYLARWLNFGTVSSNHPLPDDNALHRLISSLYLQPLVLRGHC